MLTPRFEINQTDEEVIIIVHAPYANIKDTEVYVDGDDFRFYSAPYYLRLKLPGEIEENDLSTGSYDCEKGDFKLCFSKVIKGKYFENLDMITNLLAPPKKKDIIIPNIEVIGNPSAKDVNDSSTENDAEAENIAEENDWFIDQKCPTENISPLLNNSKYGFANKISKALSAFEPIWIREIIDLPEPDMTPRSQITSLRESKEYEDFNPEHYMADLMQKDVTEPYINYVAEWETLQKNEIALSGDEIDLLKELPNKEYLLNNEEIQKLLLGLVDILFGICYNHRTTMGENTVESGWTINKLSSTLSWFEDFSNMAEVLRACVRRSLCYPLFRNWDLSMKVCDDVKKVINLGKKYVIKRLCEVHSLFNNSYEPRYVLNQLYIKDYLIWLQQIPESLTDSLGPILNDVHLDKADVGLDLIKIENTLVEEDFIMENAFHEMVDQINDLAINNDETKQPQYISPITNKQFAKYLLSSSSSSEDSSDIDSESDSETTSSSSSTTTSDSTSLDSDDESEPE